MVKEKIKKIMFNWFYEPVYLILFSIKDAGLSIIETLKELKKPRPWLAILTGTIFVALITKRYDLFKWIIPLIAVMYMYRHKLEGKYINEMKINSLLNDNDLLLKPHYNKYLRECYFTKKAPLDYEDWKKEELNRVMKE